TAWLAMGGTPSWVSVFGSGKRDVWAILQWKAGTGAVKGSCLLHLDGTSTWKEARCTQPDDSELYLSGAASGPCAAWVTGQRGQSTSSQATTAYRLNCATGDW